MPMKTLRHCLLLLAIALLAAACSTSRKAAGTTDTVQADTAWHTLYAPVKVNLSSPIAFGASGRATMVRDSLVHISMRFFGMEVAVLRATADSAWVVDKFHKIYSAMPLADLGARWGLTLGDVQDFLLGRADPALRLPTLSERLRFAGSDYTATPGGAVASEINFSAKAGRRDIAGTLTWDLGKARWNTPVSAATPDLAGYRFIEPGQLPGALKGL